MASRSIYSDTKIRVRASNLSPRQRYTIELKNITTGESKIFKQNSIGTSLHNCCIAKLVHDAITCSCKCHKCVEDLKRAETIYLLLQSAKHEAHVLGNVEMAAAKVLKAKELCTEVCACGC